MATQRIEVEGIFEWAKVFEVNRDYKFSEETDGQYQLSVIVDADTAKKLKAAGCRRRPSIDEEGRGQVFRFTRPHHTSNSWQCGAPKVAGPDGSPWNIEEDGLIGNGSSGRVLLEIYDTTKGTGTHLVAVQVTDHVQYVSEGGSSSDSTVSGPSVDSFFKNTAGASPKPKAATPAPQQDLASDEIPF